MCMSEKVPNISGISGASPKNVTIRSRGHSCLRATHFLNFSAFGAGVNRHPPNIGAIGSGSVAIWWTAGRPDLKPSLVRSGRSTPMNFPYFLGMGNSTQFRRGLYTHYI